MTHGLLPAVFLVVVSISLAACGVQAFRVTISCAKEGYRTLDIAHRRLSGAADAPVVVEWLLERLP
jgi:hypothetical protein